jgi:hypothetical protein
MGWQVFQLDLIALALPEYVLHSPTLSNNKPTPPKILHHLPLSRDLPINPFQQFIELGLDPFHGCPRA